RALGAARDALAFERGELLLLRPMVEHDPADHQHKDRCGDRISRDDEIGMRSKIDTQDHDALPGAACARISMSERTRRRRISLRIAAICSVTNSSRKATAIVISGIRMVGWIAGPPSFTTDAG